MIVTDRGQHLATMLMMSAQCRILHAEIVVSAVLPVITHPGWELDNMPGRSKHGEHQNEANNGGASVHARTENVVILDEPLGAVLAQVKLGEEASGVVKEESAVGALLEVCHCGCDDGRVPVVDPEFRDHLVDKPERQRGEEPDDEGEGHPLISGTSRVHVFCEATPADSLCGLVEAGNSMKCTYS
jgi:hypothetical protein